MTATVSDIRAYFVSQRLLGGRLNACRIGTDWNMSALATGNESALNNSGRPKSVRQRRRDIKVGRAATGDVDRAGYNQGHVDEYHGAMFPGLPMPTKVDTRDFGSLMALLPVLKGGDWSGGDAIAIAVDLAADAELRRCVSGGGHELGLRGRQWYRKSWRIRTVDPACNQSDAYTGHWVSQNAVRKGAKAVLGGIVIAELYPVLGWTGRRLGIRVKAKTIRKLEAEIERKADRILRFREQVADLKEQLAQSGDTTALRTRIAELEAAIAEAVADLNESLQGG